MQLIPVDIGKLEEALEAVRSDISDKQRKALTDALGIINSALPIRAIGADITAISEDDERGSAVFWETLGREYFFKGRTFDNALIKAKNDASDYLIDNMLESDKEDK